MCLEAGRIMENESPALAMTLPSTLAELEARLATMRRAGEDILMLAIAAEAVLRRSVTVS